MAYRNLTLSLMGMVNVAVALDPVIGNDKLEGLEVCVHSKLPLAASRNSAASTTHNCGGEHKGPCEKAKAYMVNGEVAVPDQFELEALKIETSKNVDLEHSCPAEDIDPIYFDKSYLLRPQKGAPLDGKLFWMIEQGLLETGRAIYGRACLNSQSGERMIVLRYSAAARGMILHTCHFDAQVRRGDIEKIADMRPDEIEATSKEAELLAQVIKTLDGKFEPALIVNEQQQKLRALVEGAGVTVKAEKSKATDLEKKLQQAVAAQKKGKVKA